MSEPFAVLKKTPKGDIQLDTKSFKRLGWFGKLLLNYRDCLKQKDFIEAAKENNINSKLHVAVTISGTLSGRPTSRISE